MRIPRIYTDQALSAFANLSLEEAPSHHLSKVLRMEIGRPLIVFNGKGSEFQAVISGISKKHVEITLAEEQNIDRQSPLKLTLAIGISKGDRMDWVLQKATELGITRIVPLLTERTEIRLKGDRLAKRQAHWQQVLISACEQCQRNRLPELFAPQELNQWLTSDSSELKFVLHHRDSKGLPENATPSSVSLLIGPEGGLSEEEITEAKQQGYQPLTLGPRVLRTETAPIAAISLAQYLWGDL